MSKNQKALSFLETMVLEAMDKWPAHVEVDEQAVIDLMEIKKRTFVDWMQCNPAWLGLIAADLSMDENQVRDCYNNPVAFKDYCHNYLWNYYKNVLCDYSFEEEVTSILVRHKFIKSDEPEQA